MLMNFLNNTLQSTALSAIWGPSWRITRVLYPIHKFNNADIADNIRIIWVIKLERDQNYPHFFDAAIIRIIAASGSDSEFVNAIPK